MNHLPQRQSRLCAIKFELFIDKRLEIAQIKGRNSELTKVHVVEREEE
jgi:hypothetical protein